MALGACGFEPLYGERPGVNVNSELARIRIQPIANRSGQILRNYLIDGLTPRGTQSDRPYTLQIELQEPRQEVGIRRDDIPTRVAYTATVVYWLRDAAGRILTSGSSSSLTSFEISDSEFATIAALQSSRERALQEISTDLRNQLAVYFRDPGRPVR